MRLDCAIYVGQAHARDSVHAEATVRSFGLLGVSVLDPFPTVR